MKILQRTLFFVFIIVLSINTRIFPQEVPAGLQAALFNKIFAFDKTLQVKGNIEVAVLGSGDEIAAAFKSAGINVKSVGGDQVPSGVSVVYVSSGVPSTKQQTSSKGILSISGVASYAEEGKVAIGIGTEGGKPKIIINLAQLKAEGHEVSADLLQIAKVIQ
ncbi:MAG TPA: YfiR family protein [Ignavibacteriaceae bacterium]|nr:YfiR family protein [Ignavibacteriaceae bacterium]